MKIEELVRGIDFNIDTKGCGGCGQEIIWPFLFEKLKKTLPLHPQKFPNSSVG